MSIKATITKTLVIESPQKLYEILNYHKELVKNSIELKIFMDQMDLSIEGCKCDFFDSVAVLMDIYCDLHKVSQETKESMKKIIGCDKIIFKSKSIEIFEF